MFKRILVPLDGSSFAEAALPAAVAFVRRSGGALRLLSVQDRDEPPRQGSVDTELRGSREAYLAHLSRGRGSFDHQVSTVIREGAAGEEILEEAEAFSAQLIVMATHGRGAVSRLWLGSVGDHCLRHARVPLLLIRPRPSEAQAAPETFSLRRVVLPVDGTKGAEAALAVGVAVASDFKAPVSLVRVVDEATPENAGSSLESLAAQLRCRGLEASARVVSGDHPTQAILEQAAGDLVVMATHSRPVLGRAFLGSVADKVVRGARGPVLVVPPSIPRSDPLQEMMSSEASGT